MCSHCKRREHTKPEAINARMRAAQAQVRAETAVLRSHWKREITAVVRALDATIRKVRECNRAQVQRDRMAFVRAGVKACEVCP